MRRWARVWLVFDPDNPNNVYAGTRPAGGGGRGGGGGGRGAPPVTDARDRFADLSLHR